MWLYVTYHGVIFEQLRLPVPDFLIIYQRHNEGALCLAFPEKQMALQVLAGDRCEVSGAGGLCLASYANLATFCILSRSHTKWSLPSHPVCGRGGEGTRHCEEGVCLCVIGRGRPSMRFADKNKVTFG